MDFEDHEEHEHARYQPTEEDVASAREKADLLKDAAQKLGLYLQNADLGTASGPDGSLRMVVIGTFSTGDITFTDRVLRPEEADINDEFIALKTQLDDQEFEEYRANLERKMKGGDDADEHGDD
jgi:hypothetical protein